MFFRWILKTNLYENARTIFLSRLKNHNFCHFLALNSTSFRAISPKKTMNAVFPRALLQRAHLLPVRVKSGDSYFSIDKSGQSNLDCKSVTAFDLQGFKFKPLRILSHSVTFCVNETRNSSISFVLPLDGKRYPRSCFQ